MTAKRQRTAAPKEDDWGIELDELDEQSDFLNILYYGNEGTGKTTHLATMANLGPIVYINAESGAKKRPLVRHGINVANIKVFPKAGQPLTFDLLEKLFWKMNSDLDDDPTAWAGVAWDSLTEIHQVLLANIAEINEGKMTKAGMEVERFFKSRDYYGTMTEQMRFLLRRFRDLPCHFGATALMRRDQDEDGEVSYGPAVTPALQNDLLGFVDLAALTEIKQIGGEDEYRGTFRPKAKYRAKERLAGAVPKQLVNPTFERVLAYYTEDLTIATDPDMQEAKARRQAMAAEQAAQAAAE